MMYRFAIFIFVFSFGLIGVRQIAAEAGDPAKGKELYRACASCHSLEPGRHMTGPSLASIWGQKAGDDETFARYSKALKKAEVIWDEPSLDAWLANPKTFIPGNRMAFRGIEDQAKRLDLIAYLQHISEDDVAQGESSGGESEGMMGQGRKLDLKALEANNRITSIKHCGDTYTVLPETGESYVFWEFNLRFKTDSSEQGPVPGRPVIIPASMHGDRAFVIFASPSEISPFIEKTC